MHDGRALTEKELDEYRTEFYRGLLDDGDIDRLFETIDVQRRVLRELFSMFKQESPLRRVSVANPIRNSQLAYLKELVSMEDGRSSL